MHTITLICSTHNVNGTCNVEQLVKILEALRPDIIFQEVRPSDGWTLEAQAAMEYRNLRAVQLVHVDDLKAPVEAVQFKPLLDSGLEYVAQTSEEYRLMEAEIQKCSWKDGFCYLNGLDFVNVRTRMSEIEDEILGGRSGDALRWWRDFMHRREIEMVRNIYAHCRMNDFETGAFLVGAGHKTGVAKLIQKFSEREPNLIIWKFYGGQRN